MRVIGYARVSTDDQAREGCSLAQQSERIEAYATARGFELVRVEVDAGCSASSLDRPALQQALTSLRTGEAGGLVVLKLDRLTRSVRDLGTLIERDFAKVSLFSISESVDTKSAAGRMFLRIVSTISEWEREVVSERTAAALQHLKRQGRRTGGLPYGLRLVGGTGKQMEPDPAEQAVIALACELRAAGNTLWQVSAILEERGHVSRSGRPFFPTQIRQMVAAA